MTMKLPVIAALYAICYLVSFGADSGEELAFLKAAQAKIEDGTFSRQEASACGRYSRSSKTNQNKFRLLLASYQRRVLGYPARSLDIVAPEVFDPADYADWKKRNAAANAERLKVYNRDLAAWKLVRARDPRSVQAPPPPPPDILVDLPVAEKWRVGQESVLFAVEGVNCLCEVGRFQEALQVIDQIGKGADAVGRIHASESIGDLFAGMRLPKKALEMYDAALNFMAMHKSRFSAGEEDLRRAFEAEIAIAAKRIADKRARMAKLVEIEQYGPEWVLYRDAEVLRRDQGRPHAALRKYRELAGMAAGTMFGDAAEYGIIRVYLSLADHEGASALGKEKAERTAALERRRRERREIAALAPSPSALARMDDGIAAEEQLLRSLAALPTGADAGIEALRLAKVFLDANEFGLYRGEVLFELGNYHLECRYDVKTAIQRFAESKAWCDAAFKLDKDLSLFPVPGKSASVSAPPKAMKQKDAWGNIDWAVPAPGKLFNRRTAKWYLGHLRIMVGSKLALAYFLDGKKTEAVDELWVITAFDDIEERQWKAGLPNSYSRLRRGFEEDRLFATQEDIRHFKGTARIQLLVADYYYELEQWHEAKRRYARMHEEQYERLDTTARAYLDLVRAHGEMLTGGYKAAFPMFKKFETQYRNTPSWDRAIIALQQIALHYPERALGIQRLFEAMFQRFLSGKEEEYLRDADLVGFALFGYAGTAPNPLSPLVRELYRNMRDDIINHGDYDEVVEESMRPLDKRIQKSLDLVSLYDNVVATWGGYSVEADAD